MPYPPPPNDTRTRRGAILAALLLTCSAATTPGAAAVRSAPPPAPTAHALPQQTGSPARVVTRTGYAAAERTRGESNVRGRVVYEDTGRPVRRARVALVRADAAGADAVARWAESVGVAMPSASGHRLAGTDREGEFHFKNVVAGRYFVVVDSPGVVSPVLLAESEEEFVKGVAAGRIKGGFAEVTVDGRGDARVDVRARRGGVITGRAAYADGRPAAGALVSLFRVSEGVLTQLQIAGDEAEGLLTDGRGVYRVAGLGAGEYVVRVAEASAHAARPSDAGGGYTQGALVFAYHPGTAALAEARPVSVEEGREAAGVDVTFPAREVHTVSGRVLSRRGQLPLASVQLTLELYEDGYDDSMPESGVSATTDEEGRFRIGGVPDGKYTLRANVHPAGEDSADEEGEGGGRVKTFVGAYEELKVEGADLRDVTLRLGEGASISGVVVVEGRARLPSEVRLAAVPAEGAGAGGPVAPGAATDEARAPTAEAVAPTPAPPDAAGAPATMPTPEKASEPLLSNGELWWMLDDSEGLNFDGYDPATGEFEISNVAEGAAYLHVVVADAGAGYYVKSMTRRGENLLRAPLRVAEGERVDGVRIVLAPGAATLSGRVLKAGGAGGKAGGGGGVGVPAGETEVALIPSEPARRRALGASVGTTTGPDSRFEIQAPPGEYYVFTKRAKAHLYMGLTEEEFVALAAKLPRVTLRRGERRQMNLTAREEK